MCSICLLLVGWCSPQLPSQDGFGRVMQPALCSYEKSIRYTCRWRQFRAQNSISNGSICSSNFRQKQVQIRLFFPIIFSLKTASKCLFPWRGNGIKEVLQRCQFLANYGCIFRPYRGRNLKNELWKMIKCSSFFIQVQKKNRVNIILMQTFFLLKLEYM